MNTQDNTALVIVPPRDIQGFADYYRRLYMPEEARRIEPHITVVHPFVPLDELAAAEPRLRALMASLEPRWVSFRGFSTFPDEGVLYLRIHDDEHVLSICRAVVAEFPGYPPYGGAYEKVVPHLTVGLFSDPAELQRVSAELAMQRLFIGWVVDEVLLKYRDADGWWATGAVLPLGSGEREDA